MYAPGKKPKLFIYNRWNMRTFRSDYPYRIIGLGLVVLGLLAACSPVQTVVPAPETDPSAVATVAAMLLTAESAGPTPTVVSDSPTVDPGPTEMASLLPSSTPTLVPPEDDRLKPEDWQDWPVVPVVSGRAKQIYEAGLAAGTDPSRFSKVGDCQAIKNVLLGVYDKPGYSLRENAEALEETIRQFAGSFDRDGEAVQGGYNAASVLTPLMSNPDVCEPGETPLECETRVHNPSIMLISLEVWWDGRSPAVYEKNMRQIIEFAIGRGILPILSTKADNVEGDHSINLATARLAYEYDLPLWNWWRAAQALPNRGLDPNRPDGFHISQEHAWPERSFTALEALDAVWKSVRPVEILPSPTPEPTRETVELVQPAAGEPADLATPVPGETARIIPVGPEFISNPSGLVLLSSVRRSNGIILPEGIFVLDPLTGEKASLALEGSDLQAFSSTSRQILFSRGTDLYAAALDGTPPVLLTNRYYTRGTQSAVFMPDGGTAVFITEQGSDTVLVSYPLDGSGAWTRLSPAGSHPLMVYPPADASRIFWLDGTCPSTGSCSPDGLMVSGPDGSSGVYLPGVLAASFSPGGQWLAYQPSAADEEGLLTLASLDLKKKWPQENIGSQLLDFSWSPDGSRLSLLTLDRSDYSGQWLDVRNLVISTQDMGTKILPAAAGVNPRAVWSSDGGSLLLTGTLQTDTGYTILMRVMDVRTGEVRDLSGQAGFQSNDFIYTTHITWVPPIP